MRIRHVILSLALGLSTILALVLFPPWISTLAVSWPATVDYAWIGSPPTSEEYGRLHVDVERLAKRIEVVLPVAIMLTLGIAFMRSHRARKITLITAAAMLPLVVAGLFLYERHLHQKGLRMAGRTEEFARLHRHEATVSAILVPSVLLFDGTLIYFFWNYGRRKTAA
jgi:hypothetical protein